MKHPTYIKLSIVVIALICWAVIGSKAQTQLVTRVIAQNLNVPWEIIWDDDGNIWFTERDGTISYVNPSNGQIKQIIKLDEVNQVGEGGLLGMAIKKDGDLRHIYAVYNYRENGATMEKVVAFDYDGSSASSIRTLLKGIKGGQIHNGSRLWLAPDNTLYITTGETGNGPLAQDRNSLNGKILRINLDGSIPSDNPNPNSYIWTLGHRNPQGLVFVKGTLFSSEHGPNNDDEINIIEKGRNYGWPNVEGYCNTASEKTFCAANNVKEPIYTWTPTIAPSGLEYYDNDAIPEWKNCLLLATLKGSRLIALKLDEARTKIENATEYFVGEFGRLRDICVAPDGRVFISTSNYDNNSNSNQIIEIKPKNMSAPTPPPDSPDEGKNEGGSFRVFPNPASDYLNIDRFVDSYSEKAEINIYNSLGSRINIEDLTLEPVDLSGFAPGLYYISINGEVRPFSVIR